MEPTPAVALNKLPATALGGDVGVAAAGSAAEGFGYVGVWVADVTDCANIGTAGAKNFAVITTSTFRDGPSAAYGNFGALVDGKVALKVGGANGERSIALAQTAPDTLTIDGKSYVRCVP